MDFIVDSARAHTQKFKHFDILCIICVWSIRKRNKNKKI